MIQHRTIINRNKVHFILATIVVILLCITSYFIIGANSKKMIYLYSSSCGYCSEFEPKLNQVLARQSNFTVERVDLQKNRDWVDKAIGWGVKVTPTVVVVEDNAVVDKLEGDVSIGEIEAFVRENQ